jgi:spoIIIJ-associated protein
MSEVDEKFVLDIQCEDEDDVQRVIGRRGQVIDALQHVVGKAVSRFRDEEYKPVIVDAADYRRRHIERLEGLAERMAEKARSSGRPVDLNPMPAHDRRIIHMALAEESGVETRSEGEGMDRHIVVFPTD